MRKDLYLVVTRFNEDLGALNLTELGERGIPVVLANRLQFDRREVTKDYGLELPVSYENCPEPKLNLDESRRHGLFIYQRGRATYIQNGKFRTPAVLINSIEERKFRNLWTPRRYVQKSFLEEGSPVTLEEYDSDKNTGSLLEIAGNWLTVQKRNVYRLINKC